MFELTGQRNLDATAILDYFAPLKKWLDEQNRGKPVGWYSCRSVPPASSRNGGVVEALASVQRGGGEPAQRLGSVPSSGRD
jgi:hypothetical protein